MRRRNERPKKKMGCLSWIGLLALVFVGLGLAGVFDDDDTESANVAESSQVAASGDVSEATEPEPVVVDDNVIEIGKTLSLADITFTITDLSIADDFEGNQALVITYDWENNSEDSKSPYLTFSAKGFQDGVETLCYAVLNNTENINGLTQIVESASRTNERLIDIAENTQSRLDNLEDLIYSQLYEED